VNAQVEAFHHRPTGSWSYLVGDPRSGAAAIIDPVLDYDPASARTGTASAQALLDRARALGWRVDWLLETHAHADHLSAGDWLRRQCAAPLGIGAGIAAVQERFAGLFDFGPAFRCDGSAFDRLWRDDERFELGTLQARVIATPGHTDDSVSYLIGDALFVGDTLFMPDAGSARCDFPGGDAATLHRSVRRMFALPDATRLFVCHDYGPGGREPACETSIGAQRRGNLHLGDAIDEATFVALRRERDTTLAVPALLLPALQVNLRGGRLPEPAGNGVRYLKIPLDRI
jgi:glyoxylase-like metal-dependent hydrolase (beta-lactamase superfamily II)